MDESVDSGEEEFLCPHHRYRSSDAAMGATVVRRQPSAVTASIAPGADCSQSRLFVGQERVLDKISKPIAEALYASLRFRCSTTPSSDCSAVFGLWWDRWLRFAGRQETARRILRGSGLLPDTRAADQDSRIFTAEQLNNNIEVVYTVRLWAEVLTRLCRHCQKDKAALAQLLVFVRLTVLPSVSAAVGLLDEYLGAVVARAQTGGELCLQHNVLAHDAEIYAFAFGNMYLLQFLEEALEAVGGEAVEVAGMLRAVVLTADRAAQLAATGLYLHPNMRDMVGRRCAR